MLLRREYYRVAIAEALKRFPDCTFVVFSDDHALAREFMFDEPNCVYLSANGPESAYEDLRLMSLCHHHIIANSSFSWWGAWLNERPDKAVFAPKFWANIETSYYPALYFGRMDRH